MVYKPKTDSCNIWNFDVTTAMELGYSDEVIDKLLKEPNSIKRQHILTTAREALVKEEYKRCR